MNSSCPKLLKWWRANTNASQPVLYFFLLMLCKVSPCKIFWLCAVVFFFATFIHLRQKKVVSYIKLQVEHVQLVFAKVTFDRMVMIFYRICIFFFFCYVVGLLQYSKSVWSKVGTPTVFKLYCYAPKLYQKW
jgi:hypothetical protein